jgi:hypothetical protein
MEQEWRSRGELKGRILLSTFLDREGESFSGRLELRGSEGVIAEISSGGCNSIRDRIKPLP